MQCTKTFAKCNKNFSKVYKLAKSYMTVIVVPWLEEWQATATSFPGLLFSIIFTLTPSIYQISGRSHGNEVEATVTKNTLTNCLSAFCCQKTSFLRSIWRRKNWLSKKISGNWINLLVKCNPSFCRKSNSLLHQALSSISNHAQFLTPFCELSRHLKPKDS